MILSLVGFCALVALLELDTTYVGQLLISRPFIVGAVLGALTGDLFLGLQVGIFTELIYIDYLPIGGVVPPSGAITAAVAILMNRFFGMNIYFAFFVGIVCGQLFSFVEKILRTKRSALIEKFEGKLIDLKLTPKNAIIKSILTEFCVVFAFLITCMALFGPVFDVIHNDISEKIHSAFKFAYYIVPWIGLCGLFLSFSKKPKED